MHRYGLMQSTVLHLACHQSYAEHDNIIFYATGLNCLYSTGILEPCFVLQIS